MQSDTAMENGEMQILHNGRIMYQKVLGSH